MELSCWPKMAAGEMLSRRKSMWMKQNNKWLSKWDINIDNFPNNIKAIKMYVQQKVKENMWERELSRKREYSIKHFNPSYDHSQKNYIGADIKWKAKMLIAQVRTSSHQLRCETSRWLTPKEEWADRICRFCTLKHVEMEWHY